MDMFDSRADISKSKYPLKKPKKNASIRKEDSQRESEAEVVTSDPTVEVTPTLE